MAVALTKWFFEWVNDPSTCPECAAGKHDNCDGRAWDKEADEPTTCACHEAGHR